MPLGAFTNTYIFYDKNKNVLFIFQNIEVHIIKSAVYSIFVKESREDTEMLLAI